MDNKKQAKKQAYKNKVKNLLKYKEFAKSMARVEVGKMLERARAVIKDLAKLKRGKGCRTK